MRLLALTVTLSLSLWVASSSAAVALPPSSAARAVEAARSLVGVPYQLGGRLRGDDGIDCQGLVFFALQPLSGCGWKSWSVYPTKSVPAAELGVLVTPAPVATVDVDGLSLEPGDIVWLVGFVDNPAEPAIGSLDDKPVWVWHLGLVTEVTEVTEVNGVTDGGGGARFVNADVFSGAVVEVGLRAYLEEHADSYAGVLVTRMERGPAPLSRSQCRRHAPMRAPHRELDALTPR